jgi:type I restriction enzyme S subunit
MMSRLVPKLRFKEFSGEWKEKQLKELGDFKGGGTPSKEVSKYWNGNMPWISSSDISKDNIYCINVNKFINKKSIKESATKIIPKNSILFVSRVGVGKLAINKKELCTSQDFTNFISNQINSYYLGYFFLANKNILESFNQGTSIKGFTKSDIETLKINIPIPKEQQKIASCLSSLDSLIEAQNKKVSALKQHKKGLMQQLFPAEGEREPKLRFKAFSGEWGEKMLEEIGEISGGGVDKKTNENERPVMLLNYMDVYNKNFIYSYDLKQQTSANNAKIQKCNIEKGDIFFTPSSEVPNDIAKSSVAMESIINGVYSYHLVRLRMFKSLDLKFRTYMFKTNSFFKIVSKLAQGSGTRYTITLPEFRSIKTLIPPSPKEQQKIANTLSTLDSLIEAQNQQINHLKQHKKGLMQQLFVSSEVGV